jgi:hypothetical protein
MSAILATIAIVYVYGLFAFGIEWALAILMFDLLRKEGVDNCKVKYIPLRFVLNLLFWPISVICYLTKFVMFIVKE